MTDTTTTTIALSFAELAFILALADDRLGETPCRRLGVPSVESADPIASAGLASLALRGLAAQRESALELAPAVAAVAAGLVGAVDTATVAVTDATTTSLTQLFIGDSQSLAVRPTAFGCFMFDGLADETSLAAVVTSLFEAAVADGQSAVAAVVNDRNRIAAVVRDGRVELSVDDGPSDLVEVSDLARLIPSIVSGPGREQD